MKIRKIVIGGLLVVIGLPVLLVVTVAAFVYVLNWTNGTLVSSGRKREYLLYVPKSYDRTKPTPLVISMHGAGVWPAQQMNLSGWNRVADEHGFIVVYPSGTGAPRHWGSGAANVRFISDLIDTVEAAYNIDPTRIYANGFSNWGRNGLCAFLRAIRSGRRGWNRGARSATRIDLVHGLPTDAVDLISWNSRSTCSLRRRYVLGIPPAVHRREINAI